MINESIFFSEGGDVKKVFCLSPPIQEAARKQQHNCRVGVTVSKAFLRQSQWALAGLIMG